MVQRSGKRGLNLRCQGRHQFQIRLGGCRQKKRSLRWVDLHAVTKVPLHNSTTKCVNSGSPLGTVRVRAGISYFFFTFMNQEMVLMVTIKVRKETFVLRQQRRFDSLHCDVTKTPMILFLLPLIDFTYRHTHARELCRFNISLLRIYPAGWQELRYISNLPYCNLTLQP